MHSLDPDDAPDARDGDLAGEDAAQASGRAGAPAPGDARRARGRLRGVAAFEPPSTEGRAVPRRRADKVPKTARSTILVVDDETEICDLVSYNLAREGYKVVSEHDGQAGLERVFASPPDLLVLDLLLPKLSGLEVLEAIRSEPRTRRLPVLVLTARSTEMDKLVGFERGADDYLTKPFSPKELVARVSAILRRSRTEAPEAPSKIGPFQFDRERHKVFLREREVHLTPTEYRLLEYLLERPGRVFSREQLLDKVWGLGYFGETRTVDVHVRRLRAKLGKDAGLIRTVTGVGYAAEVARS